MRTKQAAEKKKHDPFTPLSESDRWESLIEIITKCFERLDDVDPKQIAFMTGLSLGTIYNLRGYRYGLGTRFGTIQMLCAAAGLQLTQVGFTWKVKVIR